jgi:hypothetical protein
VVPHVVLAFQRLSIRSAKMTGGFTLGSRIATRLVRRTGTVAVLAAFLSLGACAGDLGFGGGSEPELSVADKGGGAVAVDVGIG